VEAATSNRVETGSSHRVESSEMIETLNQVDAKDPGESKTYTMDWTDYLNSGATISTSAWTLTPATLTNVTDGIVAGSKKASIQVSGGVSGTDYAALNTVVTSDGETLKRRGIITVRPM
jgi:hypothetical protein